jgi:hypothetical protein
MAIGAGDVAPSSQSCSSAMPVGMFRSERKYLGGLVPMAAQSGLRLTANVRPDDSRSAALVCLCPEGLAAATAENES